MGSNVKTTEGVPAKAPESVAAVTGGMPSATMVDPGKAARLSMRESSGEKATESAVATKQKSGDPFEQTLTVKDMVVWGLICMVPISPMAIYGGVFADSGGMPTLAFLIGFVAVLFSVFSFGIMIRHFPSSGSIYTYVSHVFGRAMGFIAGWLMLLQYLVSPALVYLIAASAIHSMVPSIPILALCFAFLVVAGAVSVIGMKTALVVNKVALAAQLVILALFVGFGIAFVVQHPETASFSPTNVFNPDKFELSGTMSAVSLAVMSYVGFGAIARETARRAAALGMAVAAHDPFVAADDPAWTQTWTQTWTPASGPVERTALDALIAGSDVLSLHVPLTDRTRGLIDAAALARMPTGAILINAARGGIVDEAAVAAALRSGHLGGAALDVFEREPLDAAAGAVFAGVPNLILTPHIAGVTRESNVRVSAVTAAAVRRHLTER